MGFSTELKTVMKLDDKDWKKSLKAISQAEKETTKDIEKNTKKIFDLKDKLAQKEKQLHLAKIFQNKENQKQYREEAKLIRSELALTQKLNNAQKAGLDFIKIRNKNLQEHTTAVNRNTVAKTASAKATGSMTNNLIRHLRQIETAVIAYYALSRAIQATIGVGIDVNKMVESNTFGIAALTSANTRMTDSLGNSLTAFEKFEIGQKLAKETMAQLRVESLKTPATFAQLTEIYQQATGQTLAMGDAFGTTVNSINKNTVVLAQRFSNIAGAIGQPMDRVKEEIRSALTGNVSTDSIISTMIFGSPTEANLAIKEARKRTNGLKELFDLKFEPFDILGTTRSYQKGFLQMQNAWEMTMADMVEKSGLFQDITDAFFNMADSLVKNQDEIIEGFDSLYEGGKQFVSILDEVALALTAFYGAKGAIKAFDLVNKGLDTAVGWTTVYDLKTRKATTSIKALTRQAKFLALANPFATWTIGITAVIAGLYEIQKISEEMSNKRFETNISTIASPTAGITTSSSKAEAIAAEKSVKSRMDAFVKNALHQEKISGEINNRTIRALEDLSEEYLRLGKIVDGTTKKQEEAAKKLKDATEQATLLTKISLNKEVMKELEKFSKKEKDTLAKLQDQKVKWSDELSVLNEKLALDINKDALSQKILQEARKSTEEGIAATTMEIAKIQLTEAQRQLKINQDRWVAEQNLLGVEVKKSDMIMNTMEAKATLLSLVTDEFEIEKDVTDLLELQLKYNKEIAKERAKQIKDLIPGKWAGAKELVDNAEVDKSMINYGQLLAESFQDAVQDAFDGDFDMGRLTENLTSALGSSMMSASMATLTKDMTASLGVPGGLLGGIALMGISSLFGGDDGKSQAELAEERFDKFLDSLDIASDKLMGLGNVGTDISLELTTLQAEIDRIAKTLPKVGETFKTGSGTRIYTEDDIKQIEDQQFGLYLDKLNSLIAENISSFATVPEGATMAELQTITGITDLDQFNADLATVTGSISAETLALKQQQIAWGKAGEGADEISDLTDAWIENSNLATLLTDDIYLLNLNYEDFIAEMNNLSEAEVERLEELTQANEDMISSLEGTFASLQGTIDSLRGAAVGSAYTMDLYNQSMKETQSLLASGDTDAFMESLAKTQGLTSALMDESAFEEYGRTADIQQRFAQSVAANQFEAMQTDVQTEIDILKLIEENTRIPAEVMTDPTATTAVNFIAPALNTGVDTVDFKSISRTNSSSDTDLKKQNELLEENNKLLRGIIANQKTSEKTALDSRNIQAVTKDILGEESA